MDEVMSGLSCRVSLYRDEARRGVSVAAEPWACIALAKSR